jgi:hypothetical protein
MEVKKTSFKLIAIKTDTGFLISDNIDNNNYYRSDLESLLFDGVHPEKTYKTDWFKIKDKPTKIEKKVKGRSTNKRYEIKPEFDNGKVEKVIPYKNVLDEEGEYLSSFENIKGIYNLKYDLIPDSIEEVDFEWEQILEIESFKEPEGFSYQAAGWNHENYPNVTQNNLKYDLISRILTPSILLHTQPCKLSSKETYDIIRKYVQQNINPRVAKITSDYDFCFEVKKIVPLAKPYSFQSNVGTSKRPKYNTHYVKDREVSIFEMTHSSVNNGKGYDKYTPVSNFSGMSQDDLKKNIDSYLEDLINYINTPVCECIACNGEGVIFDTTRFNK